MLADLTALGIITYRASLALQFSDVVTGRAVTTGLRVSAWRFDPANPGPPASSRPRAEKSPNSGIYGVRSLPGLERYQIGDTVPAESLSFIVHIEDQLDRYLPQIRRYDLPLPMPAVQLVPLYSSPNRPTPTGFGAIRAQLGRTTAPSGNPPEVTIVEPAAWARIAVSVPADNSGDPPNLFHGLADGRGSALILVPYPIIASDVLLNEAEWTVTVAVEHEAAAIASDYDLLEQLLANLDRAEIPPFQSTL
jgi:hypothetical protein